MKDRASVLNFIGWIILVICIVLGVNSFSHTGRIGLFTWILLLIWIVIRFICKGKTS